MPWCNVARDRLRRLRPGHDAREIGVLLRVLRTAGLALELSLLATFGLLSLPLLPEQLLLALLGGVVRARFHVQVYQRFLRPPP